MEPHAFTDYENWIMTRTSDFISDCEDICLEKGLEKMNFENMKILEDGTGFKVITEEVAIVDDEPKTKTRSEPKYSLGDRVVFETARKRVVGNIRIVDAYGTFIDDSEPYYDIYSHEDKILYKHVPESKIAEKFAEKLEVGVYHEPKYSCGDPVVFEIVTNVESWKKKK